MTAEIKPPAKMGKNFPKWTEKDGPTPYVFQDYPAGERCAWSCVWSTAEGLVTPEMWGAWIENMDREQMLCELRDAAVTLHHDPYWQPQIQETIRHQEKNQNIIPRTVDLLRQVRISYREYVSPWNPPPADRLHVYRKRDTWERNAKEQQKP